jgi:hypothetical protein
VKKKPKKKKYGVAAPQPLKKTRRLERFVQPPDGCVLLYDPPPGRTQ